MLLNYIQEYGIQCGGGGGGGKGKYNYKFIHEIIA